MKKKLLLTTLFAAVCAAAWFYFNQRPEETALDYGDPNAKFRYAERKNLSPYAMFGDSSVVLLTDHERYGKQFMEVFNSDKLSEVRKIEFDQRTNKVRLFDKKDNLLKESTLDPELVARFLSVDPRADKYMGWSPYNYVLGNPIRNIDPRGDTVRIVGGNGTSMNWMPGMQYDGNDAFVGQTVGALNLLFQNRSAGNISLANGNITGNVFDFAGDANRHVSIRNMWNADGTAFNPLAAAISIHYTNESGTEILFDPFTGVHVGDLSPEMASNPANSYHTSGNLSPATLLGHELGHAWLTQYAPDLKSRLRASSNDVEHSNIIHGRNGIETRFGMALDGAARVFRTPYNTINPPQLVPGSAPLRYYDYIITTNGATSNVPILNRYNH